RAVPISSLCPSTPLFRSDEILAESVSAVVRKQKDVGVTIPNDGEYGKAMSGKVDYGAWWSYSFQRLGGLELKGDDINAIAQHVRSEEHTSELQSRENVVC